MKYIGLFDEKEDIVTKEKLDAKQDKITVSGILKGDGAGGVSAAVANTDYATCTNLRNGSAEGSLRTINSREPDEFYVMGKHAFVEGTGTQAQGMASHAEGSGTSAQAPYSHAEGYATYAGGSAAHAEGFNTRVEAGSNHSHTEGRATTANHKSQHVQGEYNIADDSTAAANARGNYAHIVGNGTSDSARSNAHTLDWSGNAWFAGDVYVGSTSGTNKDEGSQKLVNSNEVLSAIENASETYFATQGSFESNDFTVSEASSLSSMCSELNTRILACIDGGVSIMPLKDVMKPCLIIRSITLPENSYDNIILKYSGIGSTEESSKFTGFCFDIGAMKHYAVSVEWNFESSTFTNKQIDKIEDKVFFATYGTTTYEEIKAAYDAGKVVLCRDGNLLVPLSFCIVNVAVFSSCSQGRVTTLSRSKFDSIGWTKSTETIVPDTRTINGKALSDDIKLGAVYTATLTAAGWATSGAWKTQTVSVTGLKASYNAAPFADVALSGTDAAADAELAAAWLGISASAIANTAANSLTVKFPATVDAPTVNIPIRVTTYD